MTSLSDFPRDVLTIAQSAHRDFADSRCDDNLTVIIARAILHDRAGRLNVSGLTSRQAECLRAIQAHQAAHGVSPTVRNLMAALSLASSSGVIRLLEGLEDRGVIKRLPNRSRAITIIANPAN